MIYDAKIDKPPMTDGKSDPVNVFTSDGLILTAWYGGGWWHDTDGETFGNVLWWSEIKFPSGWKCDWSRYGGE